MSAQRPIERKLTTILAADAANYSGRMARDEVGTVRALRAARDVIDATITARGGRIANTSGDGLIAEFPSVVEAVSAAVEIQRTLNSSPDQLPFRVGVHLGDVIVEGRDLLGDGVNLAARLQEMAEIGGILVSQQVRDQIRSKLPGVVLRPLEPATPKHFEDEIALFAVQADGVTPPRLLDNLGPKVAPARPAMAQDHAPDTSSTALRATYERQRKVYLGSMAGLVVLDVLTGVNAWIFGIPFVILAVLLYRKWRALRAAERAA